MPRYNQQAQLLILNVLAFFEFEKDEVRVKGSDIDYINFNNPFERASKALKISERTLYNIKKNGIQKDSNFAENLAKITKEKKTKITDYMKQKIRDTIYRMYASKEYVTLASLHKKLNDELSGFFTYSISSLSR
jgi:hypothetical protein